MTESKVNNWPVCVSDFLFKFLVIGNAGTGKSCLLHQFIEKRCKSESCLDPLNSVIVALCIV